MNKQNLALLHLILLANVGCASERLYVKVIDDEGMPVSNAVVHVDFSTSHILFGGGHNSTDETGHAEGKSDKDGNVIVKFNCQSSDFGWHADADGFYRGNSNKEHFKFEEVIIPPCYGKVILHEHEKHGKAVLYRKKNPQPMFAYTREMGIKSPVANGRYGFDLQCFDWLPPYGKGKTADFYYVRERPDETNITKRTRYDKSGFFQFKKGEPGFPSLGDVIARIEFDERCGAYVENKTGYESFPAIYRADTSREFKRSFPIAIANCDEFGIWLQESPVIGKNEYMVIRSRVKCDEHGNIISANYSKIIGSFGLAYQVGVEESVFNPRANDTNLEFDPSRNLYQGKKGRGMIP